MGLGEAETLSEEDRTAERENVDGRGRKESEGITKGWMTRLVDHLSGPQLITYDSGLAWIGNSSRDSNYDTF